MIYKGEMGNAIAMTFECPLKYTKKLMRPFRYEPPIEVNADTFPDVQIGAYTYVNGGMLRERTRIGRFCSIAYGVSIGMSSHAIHHVSTHPFSTQAAYDPSHTSPYKGAAIRNWREPTELGHDVWVAQNVVIGQGCKVGTGAVLAAGAIVFRDVPPYAIVGGVPARLIRYRFPEDVRAELLASEWWNYPIEVLLTLPTNNIRLFLDQLRELQPERAKYEWIEF